VLRTGCRSERRAADVDELASVGVVDTQTSTVALGQVDQRTDVAAAGEPQAMT
jgi:hypothetical protein